MDSSLQVKEESNVDKEPESDPLNDDRVATDANNGESGSCSSLAVFTLRESVRRSHPEIDHLYSDAYLATVVSVPNRTYEYARDEKIMKALEWRRSYEVDALTDAFQCDEGAGGVFRLVEDTVVEDEDNHHFIPSQSLVDVCLSGAFCFAGFDGEGKAILHARTALLDWWRTGVDNGIRYHVLVLEHALRRISERPTESDSKEMPESMVLYVDTSNLSLIPPPIGSLTGMTRLLQRAYPDRLHRIYVGPVNSALKKLFELVSPFLRPRSREKIVLMECPPNRDTVKQLS